VTAPAVHKLPIEFSAPPVPKNSPARRVLLKNSPARYMLQPAFLTSARAAFLQHGNPQEMCCVQAGCNYEKAYLRR